VGAELVLVVSYSVPLPAAAPQTALTLPLVWLDQFTETETTVRVWAGPHPTGIRIPVRVNGPWSEIAPQAVRDIPDFPAMSFVASGIDVPLELLVEDVAGGPLARLAIDRIWIQALVEDTGRQGYRIRALLRSVHSQNVDLELPLPPAVCQFQAFIDGRRLTWITPDPLGSPRTVRLRLEAEPTRAIRVLELMYAVGAGTKSASPWSVTLAPPRWSDDAIVPAARWQIGFADGRAAVTLDRAEFVQQWVWDRGLVRPQPIWTTPVLSRWFAGDARFSELEVSGEDTTLAAVAAADKPIHFLTVSRALAWIVCSLSIIGLGAALSMLSARARPIIAVGIALAAACLALLAEQAMTAFITFAQPGLLMLILLGIARYVLTKRNSRQSVFLPRGVRPGLPPVVNGPNGRSAVRRRPEPTTVDAPAAPN
jgi:hypothetical protein